MNTRAKSMALTARTRSEGSFQRVQQAHGLSVLVKIVSSHAGVGASPATCTTRRMPSRVSSGDHSQARSFILQIARFGTRALLSRSMTEHADGTGLGCRAAQASDAPPSTPRLLTLNCGDDFKAMPGRTWHRHVLRNRLGNVGRPYWTHVLRDHAWTPFNKLSPQTC